MGERLRRLHAHALDAGEDFGDLYSPAGAQAFAAWVTEPAEDGALMGVNRYAFDVWRERRDLRDTFRDLDGADGEPFIAWLWQHGRTELGLEEALLPPLPAELEAQADRVPPVLVAGYLRGNLGLGAAARGYTQALQAADVPVATATIEAHAPEGGPAPPERAFEDLTLPDGVEPAVNLLAVNAYDLPRFAERAGEELLRSRYTIGQWAWETDAIPPYWDSAFELVDELWVYSTLRRREPRARNRPRGARGGRAAAGRGARPGRRDGPVRAARRLPLPVRFRLLLHARAQEPARAHRGVHAGVRARARARRCVLKTINGDYRPEARERLRHAIGGRDGHPDRRRDAGARGDGRAVGARRLLRLAAPR